MKKEMTEQEMLAVNCAYEMYRKAFIRATRDRDRVNDLAGKTIYMLQRKHDDNMIHRWISTAIAISDSKEKLMDFCRQAYGEDMEFDEKDNTAHFNTDMGEAYFTIETVALVS